MGHGQLQGRGEQEGLGGSLGNQACQLEGQHDGPGPRRQCALQHGGVGGKDQGLGIGSLRGHGAVDEGLQVPLGLGEQGLQVCGDLLAAHLHGTPWRALAHHRPPSYPAAEVLCPWPGAGKPPLPVR